MNAVVQGASRGIGLELVRQLVDAGHTVIGTCRDPAGATDLASLCGPVRLDLTDEPSIAAAAALVQEQMPHVHLLLNVSGLLHSPGVQPEKRVEHLDPAAMAAVFAVNAFGPALVAKHFLPVLSHRDRAVLANLSARVGSIEDNRLGGWYSYRASKAAQNQFTRTTAVEFRRRARNAIVVALHPGTVETGLSAPFRRNVPAGKLFTVERAARQLLDVVAGLKAEDTGGFFAWDGSPIPY